MTMFDTFDRTGNAEFPFPKTVVYQAICEAVRGIRGMTVERKDELTTRLEVKTGMSAFSWGEKITISVSSSGQNAIVSIGSGAKTIIGSATSHGKNKKNVSDILNATSTLLERHGQEWLSELAPPPIAQAALPDPHNSTILRSVADELMKLAKLRDEGIITDAEFDALKSKIIS
ncbi:hypothetical protein GOZ90_09650 [Agrobacterium vitis]|uniref:SHOCT domain-containing protein n=1 Tax=Agrobacterium vitis TaxID=373 RepID=A0A6L6VB95_AGRVI|nr:SHOCT domain-containing protein [Agrobacterium vitis]MUZ72946.1 hypothetical protein [Agrobacterium vitis]